MRKIAENYTLPYYTLSPTYSICKEHGYIAGEVYTCPECGAKTEVYSRITGYYRPVQNWNDGKSKEFKDRKVYNIENSVLKRSHADHAMELKQSELQPQKEEAAASNGQKEILLVTTRTCPNCKLAAKVLEDAGVLFKTVLAEENADLVREYVIMQAPTLLVNDGETVTKYTAMPEIHQYIAQKV